MRRNSTVLAALLVILGASPASADEPLWGFGARVGGYGFREAAEDGGTSWEDCRMGGMGVFAQRALTRHVFLEGGLDQYFAEEPEEMDRVSTIGTVAGGLRMFPGRWISLHVQLGGGVEVTRVGVHDHRQADVLPMAFLGLGGDLRIVRQLRVGLNVRLNGMGHYDHLDHQDATSDMDVSPELTSQGQIYLRYDL
jgi:hypothetical protein